jgi:hypothetical protein
MATIGRIQFDKSGAFLITLDRGTWRIWEFPVIRPVTHFCLYYVPINDGRMAIRIEKVIGLDILTKDPQVRVPSIQLQYCASRRLFIINDTWHKKLDVLFVSARSFSILDEISAGDGLELSLYLANDQKTLVTGEGDLIRFWDIPLFESES